MDRTRIVRWLRVLFPLAALVMLSVLFLFSRAGDPVAPMPQAGAIPRDPRVVAPEYAGVTADGAVLSLRAAEAVPDQTAGEARDLRLDWQRPDGLRAELTAPRAGLAEGRIRLEGGVRMVTSSGWQLESPRIEAEMDRSRIAASDGVRARAPFGTLTARQLELAPDPGRDASILKLSGDVRLIYQP